ncbi:hypothetical protein EDD18DRAFT_216570 [Armillaria luteobubalina]|uniref:Uncharacterized protein n=1 Tax=Armillaria luteobubalina TaxID=153913 RepID=A0AA39P009_9AGAR|nr:hypothetical protein EDD18DRAFT_216570 [Armillaria luteobubalina]
MAPLLFEPIDVQQIMAPSLSFSLTTTLFAVLMKQWVYVCAIWHASGQVPCPSISLHGTPAVGRGIDYRPTSSTRERIAPHLLVGLVFFLVPLQVSIASVHLLCGSLYSLPT